MSRALPVITQVYLQTALWASYDPLGEPLGRFYTLDDFDDNVTQTAIDDCVAFLLDNFDIANKYDSARLGCDLWLTRNNHGAGFWDGDYPEPDATILTNYAKNMGEIELLVDDTQKGGKAISQFKSQSPHDPACCSGHGDARF